MYKEIVESLPGTLWYQPTGPYAGYWLRVEDAEHREGRLVDILSGKFVHAGLLTNAAHVVSWREVMF